jgi:preprotein translocase subunit SecE
MEAARQNRRVDMAGVQEKLKNFVLTFIPKSKAFVEETLNELKKSSWPNKRELMESTLLVIVSLLILAVFVAAVDKISVEILAWLTSS